MLFLFIFWSMIEHNQAGIPRLAVIPYRCSRSIYSEPENVLKNK